MTNGMHINIHNIEVSLICSDTRSECLDYSDTIAIHIFHNSELINIIYCISYEI